MKNDLFNSYIDIRLKDTQNKKQRNNLPIKIRSNLQFISFMYRISSYKNYERYLVKNVS